MKSLEVDPMYRKYLVSKRAIVLDEHGNECLAGLTAVESIEYIAVMEMADIRKSIKTSDDLERMLALYERHYAALRPMR